MRRFCFSIIFLTLTASLQAGTTYWVPGNYSTIQAALNASVDHDTIQVLPGTYGENIDFLGKLIVLSSTDGPEATTIVGSLTKTPTITINKGEPAGTEVNGFTITGGDKSGILIYNAKVLIRNNIITGNDNSYNYSGGGLWLNNSTGSKITKNLFYNNDCGNWGGGIYVFDNCESDTISYNIFYDNGGDSEIATRSTVNNLIIENNTIVGHHYGIRSYASSVYIFNNIIFGTPNTGINVRNGSAMIDYNCFFDNTVNYGTSYVGSITVGTNNIFKDAQFINRFEHDYRLLPFSPCVGNAANGGDIGALSYIDNPPMPYNISLGAEEKKRVVSHTPTFYWSFYDPMGSQDIFRMEVDTNFDWSDQSLWQTGDAFLSDTELVYGGTTLLDSLTYYYRLQVSNGIDWSDWVVNHFSMNTSPTEPTPNHPTALQFVSTSNVNLIVENSYDAQQDSLVYDFELSEDIFFGTLTDSKYGIAEQSNLTASGRFLGLPTATRFYWRCRSFDGYEYSNWSETESFITRNASAYHVPGDYSNIQAALDAAGIDDSVIVAAGTYSGTGNRDLNYNGKNIILKSEAGAKATIIDCGGSEIENHIGFIFENGEDSSSVVDGFTITNAFSDYYSAIRIRNGSAVTFNDCIITNNTSSGILIDWSIDYSYFNNCEISFNTGHGYYGWGNIVATNSLFHHNAYSGAVVYYGLATFRNCTFAFNGQHGLNLEGEAPKTSLANEDEQYGVIVANCLAAYNGNYGFFHVFGWLESLDCSNAFGNGTGEWYPTYLADVGLGNDSLNPLFCDTANYDYHLNIASPCTPANNSCGTLIGAFGIGCDVCCIGIRGNVNYDILDKIDIADLVYIVSYSFASGPLPPCPEEADVDGSGGPIFVDIADIVYLVNYMFNSGPAPPACP